MPQKTPAKQAAKEIAENRKCPQCPDGGDTDSEKMNGYVSLLCYVCGYHVLTRSRD